MGSGAFQLFPPKASGLAKPVGVDHMAFTVLCSISQAAMPRAHR